MALHYPAERWPHVALCELQLNSWKLIARAIELPVILGVRTPSPIDDAALAASVDVEWRIKAVADKAVSLLCPAIYLETHQVTAKNRNVVHLTGTSPSWWDTQCSKLRVEARPLSFSTVA